MHVGMATVFQNPQKARADREVYRNELRLADLAEPLGFESVWGVEHHFTDYTMCPDVLQFLTYMAGRTRQAKLGSMVVVLPWHDPLRVAEEVSMLDNISEGRLILGLGRGAGRVEFDGFRLPMDESRQRFVESAEMLLRGLESGDLFFIDRRLRGRGLRGKLARFQIGQQGEDRVGRNGVALDAASAGDVDADRLAVEIHQRAAAVDRLDDRVVLQDAREATAAVAQGAAHHFLRIAF